LFSLASFKSSGWVSIFLLFDKKKGINLISLTPFLQLTQACAVQG
jgi:hypothetical protein